VPAAVMGLFLDQFLGEKSLVELGFQLEVTCDVKGYV
jgi:hypothetical protein